MNEIKITFQPSGRAVNVLPGTLILEAAGRAGIVLQTPCGGKGTCGKCSVMIKGEAVLACKTHVEQDTVIDIPDSSLFIAGQQILETDDGAEAGEVDPPVKVIPFELPPPSQQDSRSDAARLRDAIGPDIKLPVHVMQELPRFLRKHDYHGRAVIVDKRVLALNCKQDEPGVYGVAFDVGTTTVVGTLIDLEHGGERGVASKMNGQISHGDDVIARIQACRENPDAAGVLQKAILDTLNSIIAKLCEQASIPAQNIYEVVLAGNSTMQQLLLGMDSSALGEVPFVQVFDRAITHSAREIGLEVNRGADAYIFPQIGGFVGGDTVAGMVAAKLDRLEGPVLLVDIGTNGEIVLANQGKMISASTAAGPAFEGARIRQGMRAVPGAIEKVLMDEDMMINVIGNVKPLGLCGTALIDAVAELLRKGIIDETGRIQASDEIEADLPEALLKRIKPADDGFCFELASAAEAANGEAVCLWQKDVRELQLASGAIRAGINILLKHAGVEAHELKEVLLAGAFGNFIRRNQARRIGLLPAMPTERIRFIGNAASLGAKRVMLSREDRRYADNLRDASEHIDLSLDAEFQLEFSMAMMFPGMEADDASKVKLA